MTRLLAAVLLACLLLGGCDSAIHNATLTTQSGMTTPEGTVYVNTNTVTARWTWGTSPSELTVKKTDVLRIERKSQDNTRREP